LTLVAAKENAMSDPRRGKITAEASAISPDELARRQRQSAADIETRRAISPAELAHQLGVSTASTLRGCRDGRIRCVRFGRRFLIPIGEVDRLLAAATSAA
jgi:excisionase family DNA binding protein